MFWIKRCEELCKIMNFKDFHKMDGSARQKILSTVALMKIAERLDLINETLKETDKSWASPDRDEIENDNEFSVIEAFQRTLDKPRKEETKKGDKERKW